MSGNDVNDEALTYLVESPHLANRKELNLASNEVSDDGLDVLEESLLEFPGALVLVTHDRYLIDRVSTPGTPLGIFLNAAPVPCRFLPSG